MTDEHQHLLATLACVIAIEAPIRRSRSATSSYVQWEYIDEIRAVLTDAGIDWAKLCLLLKAGQPPPSSA